jgi:hypothetical protein
MVMWLSLPSQRWLNSAQRLAVAILTAGTCGAAGARAADVECTAGATWVTDSARGADGVQATVDVCECAADGGCCPHETAC